MSLERIESRLTETIGVDPASLSRTGLKSAVRRRMQAVGASSVDAYARQIQRDAEELDRLVSAALVHETSFFRYPASFALLREEARRHADAEPDQPFCVSCVGCATGEEPASAVITLREAGFEPERVRVEAADVSQVALDYARNGRYRQRTMREVPPGVRARYFRQDGDGWRLDPGIVSQVRYRSANVTEPSFGRHEWLYDAVFCRNLLIYLVPEARNRLLDALCRMLVPGGLLFVGHAEVTSVRERGLPAALPPEAFACRSLQASTPDAPQLAPKPADVEEEPAPAPLPPPAEPPHVEPLAEASRLADAGELERARRLLEACARDGDAGPDHYHLLAVVESAAGRETASEEALQKALYLDPAHYPSLVQLALLAEQRGETARASRLKARAERSAPRDAEDAHGDV